MRWNRNSDVTFCTAVKLCLQANLSLLNIMIVKAETLISHPKSAFLCTEDHDNQKDYKVLHVQLLRYPISTCVVKASEA